MKNRGGCTRFDALLKRRSTDSRRRVNASFAIRRDTSLSTAHTRRKKERFKEEILAGKVRRESAARGKLHVEVSSPTTTQDETKTEERNPLRDEYKHDVHCKTLYK
jgi:hypothetical protein